MALRHIPFVSTLLFFVAASLILSPVSCYRTTVDKKECFIQEVEAEGQMVHGSFVVIKSDNAWTTDFETVGMDLLVSATQPRPPSQCDTHIVVWYREPGSVSLS